MARGKTLLQLLTDLRAECRFSLNPAQNAQHRDTQIAALQRVQEGLWDDFDWPHLRVRREIVVQQGQRYYDVPDDLSIDRIMMIELRDGARWRPVLPGITEGQYAAIDSDIGICSWPPRQFQIYEGEQIELWPVPDHDGIDDPANSIKEGILRFTGIRKLSQFVNDDDRADLDDRLIVLFAAASLMTDPQEARKKEATAQKRYGKLRGHLMPGHAFKMFSGSDDRRRLLRGPPTVSYRTVSSS